MKAKESHFEPKTAQRQMILGSCPICLDTGVIVDGRAKYCSCDRGQAAKRRRALLDDCRCLSGSTMGTLTGLSLYQDIDLIQSEFVVWVADPAQPEFKNWQAAWAGSPITENENSRAQRRSKRVCTD